MATLWLPEIEIAEEPFTPEGALDMVQISARLRVARTPAVLGGIPGSDFGLVSSRERAQFVIDALGGAIEQDDASHAATASLMEESSETVRPVAWFSDLPDDI